jgi:hypothetical protein
VLRVKKKDGFGLLSGDGQTAEQRGGKFFQQEKPPRNKINKIRRQLQSFNRKTLARARKSFCKGLSFSGGHP